MKTVPPARGRFTPGIGAAVRRAKKSGIADLFENESVFHCLHDLEGKITSVNDAICGALGYSRRELLGRPIGDLVAPDRRSDFDEYLRKIRSSDAATGVMTIVTRSGEKRFWHYQNTRDEQGARDVVRATAIDVTELILAERSAVRALEESEERYRQLFERSPAGIYRSSLDGTMLDCNEAFAKILGYDSREEVLAKNSRELYFYESDRAEFLHELERRARLTGHETCLRGGDGSPVWIVENVTLVEAEGDQTAMLEGSIIDITSRRQAEEAVRKSEERYRFLFEANPLPMWVYEVVSLRFLDVNDAALAHYGYSRSEFLSMRLPDMWPKEDRDGRIHPIAAKTSRAEPFESSRHVRKDGMLIDVEVSAVDLPGGPVRRRMALARDVTEMKRARNALIDSEAKFRGIFNLAPLGIYQIAPGGKILTANPAFAQMLGYTIEELVSQHNAYDLYFRPEERDDLIRGFLAEPEKNSTERQLRSKSGKPVWVQITAQMIRDDDGNVQYFEGFTFDITEKKRIDAQQTRLQEAVLESARQWRDTFDAIETPVLVVDGEGVVKRLNRAAVELAGQSYVDVLGKRLAELGGTECWATAADLLRNAAKSSSRSGALCRDEIAQKTWAVSVSGFEGFESQETPLSIVVARDVTPIVKLQESVHRAESMSSMGSLVAGVAHEVRNPLFAISATLDAFDLRFRDRDDYKKYAQALRTQLDRMNALMRDLLDYGKPAVLEFHDVEPQEIVHDAIRGCADLAARKNVPVEIESPESLRTVRVDRSRIVQVFVNLVENSIQHSPPERPVIVRLEPSAPEDPPGVLFRVEDGGAGFRPDDLPRIFDPFFTRRQGGTGLGLAIVRRIVEEHGGTIAPANRPEGGASVSVWLPCEAPEEPRPGRRPS